MRSNSWCHSCILHHGVEFLWFYSFPLRSKTSWALQRGIWMMPPHWWSPWLSSWDSSKTCWRMYGRKPRELEIAQKLLREKQWLGVRWEGDFGNTIWIRNDDQEPTTIHTCSICWCLGPIDFGETAGSSESPGSFRWNRRDTGRPSGRAAKESCTSDKHHQQHAEGPGRYVKTTLWQNGGTEEFVRKHIDLSGPLDTGSEI